MCCAVCEKAFLKYPRLGMVDKMGGGGGGGEGAPFEGFEKRLEMEFEFMGEAEAEAWKGKSLGLRGLSVAELRTILREAQCSIVAGLSNALFDSYVLSESSLFIYPLKVVIKTCGSTQLLKAIPPLLSHAAQMWLSVKGCRYSRGSFIFSSVQPFPHRSFAEEVEFMDQHLPMLTTKASYVMGSDQESRMRWHVYSAVRKDEASLEPNYTVEVCMRDLDREAAAHFFNKTSDEMTMASGIDNLLDNCEICDFAFNPCGYSMNSIERGGTGYSTIHVTPEEGYSYASFELMDFDLTTLDMQHLLNRVAAIFNPSTFSISLYTNRHTQSLFPRPTNYQCQSSTRRHLPAGGLQVFHTFSKHDDTNCSAHKLVPLPLFPKEIGTETGEEAGEDAEEGSLKGVNKNNKCYRLQCCGMDAASLQADAISSSAVAAVDIGRKY